MRGRGGIELRLRPFPDEACLRPSFRWLASFGVGIAAVVVGVGVMNEHFALGAAVLGLTAVTFFGLMQRAVRTGARATAELNAGRVEEARALYITAARRSRAFAKLHLAQLLSLAVLEVQANRSEAALSLLSSCWSAWGHEGASRGVVANAFAHAWGTVGDADAAEAWRAEALRRAREASRESPPSETAARTQKRLAFWSIPLFLVGCVVLFAGSEDYPVSLGDQKLLLGFPVAALGFTGSLLVLWRTARRWHVARPQLWAALFLPVMVGGGGVGMAAAGAALGLNRLLDRSPPVRVNRLVLDWARVGRNVRVEYAAGEGSASGQELLDEDDERARRIADDGARHLVLDIHRGFFGVRWAEEEKAEP